MHFVLYEVTTEPLYFIYLIFVLRRLRLPQNFKSQVIIFCVFIIFISGFLKKKCG